MNDAAAFLNASQSYESHPSAKFPDVGSTLVGTIVGEPRLVTTSDLDGGESEKLVLDVQTADGETFALWCPPKKALTRALADAVKKAGADRLEVGGKVAVKRTDDAPAPKPGWSPAKRFAAEYRPPAPVDLDAFAAE